MSSNVNEGWNEVCNLAAIACYVDWPSFDSALDALPECQFGLCGKAGQDPVKPPFSITAEEFDLTLASPQVLRAIHCELELKGGDPARLAALARQIHLLEGKGI